MHRRYPRPAAASATQPGPGPGRELFRTHSRRPDPAWRATESELMRQFASAARWCVKRCRACRPRAWSKPITAWAPALEPSGGDDFRIDPADIATSRDVMVLLELRVCLESRPPAWPARAQPGAARRHAAGAGCFPAGAGRRRRHHHARFPVSPADRPARPSFRAPASIPPVSPRKVGPSTWRACSGTRGYLRRDPAPGRRSRPDRHAHAPRQQPRACAARNRTSKERHPDLAVGH